MPSSNKPSSENPAAIVSGGSSGLGLALARTLLRRGYSVTILGRDAGRLAAARESLAADATGEATVLTLQADATSQAEVQAAVDAHLETHGRLDVLINVVGRSDRGRIDSLKLEVLRDLFEANVISTLIASQTCLPALRQSRGVIVNIGSLASRLAPRYLGGYVVAKHALAGLSRQLRLECEDDGVHVGLVCPGPIAGDHQPNRYGVDAASNVPESAAAPGGGAKLSQLSPDTVAAAVMRCIDDRKVEILLPGKTRLLMLIGTISPRLADWILSRKTS